MAQHISIINSEEKRLQKVAKAIYKRARCGLPAIAGSLRFEELRYEKFKINPDDRVFITSRVVNGRQEMFEVHYDTKKEEILEIFLVA
ncbi:MAG: hypothetical protein K0U19_00770 [Proteobacteria bacterium]|nr:hypothetical protein [Pseudomonadota bacterium]